jgi:hypothetical protein
MMLAWFRKPKVAVEHTGPDIIVTMPGTGYRIIYTKTEDGKLVAHSFTAPKGQNEKRRIRFPEFLALAWTAANAKARELGWIA